MRGRVLPLALAAGLVLVGTPPAVAGTPVLITGCGQHAAAHALLTRDLRCGPDDGLTLAPGATLDLGGHTFAGDGSDFNGDGLRVTGAGRGGGSSTTVRNGRVSGWTSGVAVRDIARNSTGRVRVDAVWLDDNFFAVNGASFETQIVLEIVSSRFTDNSEGVWGPGGGNATIERSTFERNSRGASADSLTVRNSTLADNEIGIWCFDTTVCDLAGNRFRGSESTGIHVYQNPWTGYDGVRIVGNTFRDNATGLDFRRSFYTAAIRGNTFDGNGVGASITDADVLLSENHFLHNEVGVTAALREPAEHTATIIGNYLTRNGDGVLVAQGSTPGYPSLGDNRAMSNAGWGIHAPGTVDLGGNRARGNGLSPQCVGVVC